MKPHYKTPIGLEHLEETITQMLKDKIPNFSHVEILVYDDIYVVCYERMVDSQGNQLFDEWYESSEIILDSTWVNDYEYEYTVRRYPKFNSHTIASGRTEDAVLESLDDFLKIQKMDIFDYLVYKELISEELASEYRLAASNIKYKPKDGLSL